MSFTICAIGFAATLPIFNNSEWYNNVGLYCYHYEGANIDLYQLPASNVTIIAMIASAHKGSAIAFGWANSNTGVWVNNLNDGTQSFTWSGWKRVWTQGDAITNAVWN